MTGLVNGQIFLNILDFYHQHEFWSNLNNAKYFKFSFSKHNTTKYTVYSSNLHNFVCKQMSKLSLRKL